MVLDHEFIPFDFHKEILQSDKNFYETLSGYGNVVEENVPGESEKLEKDL